VSTGIARFFFHGIYIYTYVCIMGDLEAFPYSVTVSKRFSYQTLGYEGFT
jgi:hypothetical protein